SEATLSACAPCRVRPVGRLVLKGKTEALQVFEPLPDTPPAGYAPDALYQSAYDALREGDGAVALARFQALQAAYPGDPLVRLHGERLAAGELGERIVLTTK